MAEATEHLKQVLEKEYGVSADEAGALDNAALRDMILSKIAESKYKVSPSELEGTDTQGIITILMQNMVSDLLKVDKSKVTSETSFSDLGADSLDMVELLMTIEDTFEPFGELKIPEEDANIGTVGEAVERIDSYISDYVGAK
jgi:acyl carrier protein